MVAWVAQMKQWMNPLLIFLVILFASFPAVSLADEPPGIVVWKLQGNENVKQADVNLISNFVANQVAKYSGAKVISEADITTILKGEETRQQCGAEDTSCVAEIGAALGVPEAVSGDIGKLGDYWMLNLRRINVRTAEVIGRSSRNIKGDINALIESLPQAVAELFGTSPPGPLSHGERGSEPKPKPSPPPEPGRLYVHSEPSGAGLFLDGDQMGETPFKQKVDVGEYKLTLKLDGYKTAKESVRVKSEETTRLNLTLERDYPMNPYKKYGYVTFFTGVGVAAILGGAGFGLAAHYANEYDSQTSGSINGSEDQSKNMAAMGYAGIAVGGALMITGIVLWVLSPGDEAWWKEHHVSVGTTADGSGGVITLSGRW